MISSPLKILVISFWKWLQQYFTTYITVNNNPLKIILIILIFDLKEMFFLTISPHTHSLPSENRS